MVYTYAYMLTNLDHMKPFTLNNNEKSSPIVAVIVQLHHFSHAVMASKIDLKIPLGCH